MKSTRNLKLEDVDWKEFFIGDIFEIKPGIRLTKADMTKGITPFVGASDNNNGITAFVSNTNASLDSNILGVNYNGSVVENFYHPYDALFSDDVKRLHLKNYKGNKEVFLFFKTMILAQKEKYQYGYKFNEKRMFKQKILLPITSEGNPHYSFMENYMRQIEQEQKQKTIRYFSQKLLANLIITASLADTEWKEFRFDEVFTEIQRGRRLTKANQIQGTMPYVSSTALDNGVDNFIGNTHNVRIFENGVTIANSGSVGSAFFHQYQFVASDHVTFLKNSSFNNYVYLFILPIVQRLSEKYSFNREMSDQRIKREKLLLPITPDGQINYNFMQQTMQKVEQDMLKNTLKFFKESTVFGTKFAERERERADP